MYKASYLVTYSNFDWQYFSQLILALRYLWFNVFAVNLPKQIGKLSPLLFYDQIKKKKLSENCLL